MSETTTDARVAEIEARASAATPGPWWREQVPERHAPSSGGFRPYLVKYRWDDVPTWIAESSDRENAKADFTFICEAREDVPFLIAQLRARDAEIERLRAALRNALAYMNSAKIDMECGTPMATAISTVNGGIKSAAAALAAAQQEDGK